MATPPNNKPGLNARAAELKEKLLRGRVGGENNSSGNGIHPQTPLSTPQATQEPRLATANDIAALIRDCTTPNINSSPNESSAQETPVNPRNNATSQSQDATPSAPSGSNGVQTVRQTTPRQDGLPNLAVEYNIEEGEIQGSPTYTSHRPQYTPRKTPKRTHETASHERATPGGAQAREVLPSYTGRTMSIKGLASAPRPKGPAEQLSQLVERDADLRDWLNMTKYFEPTYRKEMLDVYRKKLQLEEEKARIEAEEERLRQKEHELGLRRLTVAATSVTTTVTPTTLAVNAVNGAAKPSSEKLQEQPSPELPSPAPRFPGDRDYRKLEHRIQMPQNRRSASRGRGTSRGRGSPASRHAASPGHRASRQDPPPRSREYSPHRTRRHSQADYDDSRGRYRETSPCRESNGSQYPIRVDLGNKGDSRFFIIKSFNEENVDDCMRNGVWATQSHNCETFSDAFKNCRNVILLFSVNQSGAFQGFAKMQSLPSPNIPRPRWLDKITWRVSDPFRVQWLNKIPVDTRRVSHIRNSLNEGRPVQFGRDGQEIEEEAGRRMLGEMYAYVEEQIARRRPGGGGGGGGGGRPRSPIRSDRPIKREDEMDPSW